MLNSVLDISEQHEVSWLKFQETYIPFMKISVWFFGHILWFYYWCLFSVKIYSITFNRKLLKDTHRWHPSIRSWSVCDTQSEDMYLSCVPLTCCVDSLTLGEWKLFNPGGKHARTYVRVLYTVATVWTCLYTLPSSTWVTSTESRS